MTKLSSCAFFLYFSIYFRHKLPMFKLFYFTATNVLISAIFSSCCYMWVSFWIYYLLNLFYRITSMAERNAKFGTHTRVLRTINTYWLRPRETVCFVEHRQSRVHKTCCFPEVPVNKYFIIYWMSKEKKSTTNQSNMCKKDYLLPDMAPWGSVVCYLPVNKSNVHRLATLPGRQ